MAVLNVNSWHEAQPADPNNTNECCYGLGIDLYGKVSAFPEVDSGHKRFEQCLTCLESDLVQMLQSLLQMDTHPISSQDHTLSEKSQALANDPDWSLDIADVQIHISRYCTETPPHPPGLHL